MLVGAFLVSLSLAQAQIARDKELKTKTEEFQRRRNELQKKKGEIVQGLRAASETADEATFQDELKHIQEEQTRWRAEKAVRPQAGPHTRRPRRQIARARIAPPQ
jgi:predicted transcriptional regulator